MSFRIGLVKSSNFLPYSSHLFQLQSDISASCCLSRTISFSPSFIHIFLAIVQSLITSQQPWRHLYVSIYIGCCTSAATIKQQTPFYHNFIRLQNNHQTPTVRPIIFQQGWDVAFRYDEKGSFGAREAKNVRIRHGTHQHRLINMIKCTKSS